MGAVFISYRRGDAEGQARALYVELVKLLGKDSVFMDVDSIALGRDFRQTLQERLGSSDVMLALIGPAWLDACDSTGARRLESSTDFVRQEIAAALKRNIPVIPLLVQDTQVPPPERLPEDLKDLSYRNAFELSHTTWESDIQELVRRLGLNAPKNVSVPTPPSSAAETLARSPAAATWLSPQRLAVGAALALVIGGAIVWALYDWQKRRADTQTAASTPVSPAGQGTPLQSSSGVTVTPLPAAPVKAQGDSGATGSVIDFTWPGTDCWDIFRAAEYVTHRCGAATQALAPGTYTIKGKYAAVFTPFNVTIKPGAPTRMAMGGVFEFVWPGNDCWDIFRGDEYVTHHCGPAKQALGAGTYIVKGKSAAVVTPFTVDVKDGSATRVAKGGVFSFKWPGGDCWDIFRGPDYVTHQCGTNKQALEAGTYTIKGKYAAVFPPFEIKIVDGAEVVKAP